MALAMVEPLIIVLIPVVVGALSNLVWETLRSKKDKQEIQDDLDLTVNKFIKVAKEQKDDVFTLMVKNVAELREYYTINKQQARRSFNSALIISILGFSIFLSGIYLDYQAHSDIVKISTLAGGIVEIIAGLFFWLYKKALDQINTFHVSLLKTEKFLTAIQLVEKISKDKRDENYSYIIRSIVSSNLFDSFQLQTTFDKKKVKVPEENV